MISAAPIATTNREPASEQRFPRIPQISELSGTGLNVCPLPDSQGVRAVIGLYRDKFGSVITEAEAYAILARVMRFLWALNLPDAPHTNESVPPPAA